MNRFGRQMIAAAALLGPCLVIAPAAEAAPCLIVILTGTQSGPAVFNGQAGAGTLIRIGDDSNDCGAVKLQFDAGRGTNMRLSQLDVTPAQLHAVFFTHVHGDHTEGFADIIQHRWMWASPGPKLDVVCSGDAPSRFGFTVSCPKYIAHIGDAFLQSGEIAQRRVEGGGDVRLVGGPAELTNTITFEPKNEPQVVWSRGDVKVSAIRSTHIPGHASYRVDSPAGSVVIGGDATNDVLTRLPRNLQPQTRSNCWRRTWMSSSIRQCIRSWDPTGTAECRLEVFNRQSNTTDLGAMARRANAKHLVLTHLGPSIGAARQGAYKVPGGALTAADFRKAVEASGFTGNVVVGADLTSLRLPVK